MLNIAEKWKYQDIAKSLYKDKRCLKSNSPAKCSKDSTFCSHSTAFAIWDTTDPDLSQPLQVIHDEDCADFVELISDINQVRDLVLESKDEDLLYDFHIAAADMEAYIKHKFVRCSKNWQKLMHLNCSMKVQLFD